MTSKQKGGGGKKNPNLRTNSIDFVDREGEREKNPKIMWTSDMEVQLSSPIVGGTHAHVNLFTHSRGQRKDNQEREGAATRKEHDNPRVCCNCSLLPYGIVSPGGTG